MADLKKTRRPPTYRTIRIEDVDAAIRDWFDKTVDAHVPDQLGQRQKVKVIWAAGERWVSGKDARAVRDKDGRLILPLIAIKRKTIDSMGKMGALGANVPRMQISRLISEKAALRAEEIAARSISERRLNQSAVYEVTTIPFPSTGTARYELVIQAQYTWQMNLIIEKILSRLEFYNVPTFVAFLRAQEDPPGLQVGEGSSELEPELESEYGERIPLKTNYVVAFLEGDLADSGNLDEFTDQERIIKMTMSFFVPTAFQLDPEGTRPAPQIETTASDIELGDEQTCFVDSSVEIEAIFGPGRPDPLLIERLTKSRRR